MQKKRDIPGHRPDLASRTLKLNAANLRICILIEIARPAKTFHSRRPRRRTPKINESERKVLTLKAKKLGGSIRLAAAAAAEVQTSERIALQSV